MTHKDIAERLRDMSNRIGSLTQASLTELADTIDPPRPEPGTVVWWRHVPKDGVNGVIVDWTTGVVVADNKAGIYSQYGWYAWDEIEWKPARILGPGQVAVKVPPVREWDTNTDRIEFWMYQMNRIAPTCRTLLTITRAEAERMEAER